MGKRIIISNVQFFSLSSYGWGLVFFVTFRNLVKSVDPFSENVLNE